MIFLPFFCSFFLHDIFSNFVLVFGSSTFFCRRGVRRRGGPRRDREEEEEEVVTGKELAYIAGEEEEVTGEEFTGEELTGEEGGETVRRSSPERREEKP